MSAYILLRSPPEARRERAGHNGETGGRCGSYWVIFRVRSRTRASGFDIATLLARWDAGSAGRFVARMNAQAQVLGLSHTHYVDPSGVKPGSNTMSQART